MRRFQQVVCVSLVACLTGCSVTPGQQLDVYGHAAVVKKGQPLANVEVIPLDNKVVQSSGSLAPEYVVGPQDVLNITVWDHPELTIPAGSDRSAADSGILVDSSGQIFYPFAGQLSVAGKTVNQIRVMLMRHVAKYIQKPQISVRVAGFASQKVQVMGAVKTPMSEPITNQPLSLVQAINNAGGMDPGLADARNVFVLRGPTNAPRVYWINANNPTALLIAERFYLRNKDIVYVSSAKITHLARIVGLLSSGVLAGEYVREVTK